MVAFPRAEIRIIGVPPGEAPLEIRQQWVGLILPLAGGEPCAWQLQTMGVLTGILEEDETIGYAVDFSEAVTALAEKSPAAARWWEENVSHLFEEDGVLVFHKDVCQLLST